MQVNGSIVDTTEHTACPQYSLTMAGITTSLMLYTMENTWFPSFLLWIRHQVLVMLFEPQRKLLGCSCQCLGLHGPKDWLFGHHLEAYFTAPTAGLMTVVARVTVPRKSSESGTAVRSKAVTMARALTLAWNLNNQDIPNMYPENRNKRSVEDGENEKFGIFSSIVPTSQLAYVIFDTFIRPDLSWHRAVHIPLLGFSKLSKRLKYQNWQSRGWVRWNPPPWNTQYDTQCTS